MSLKPLSQAVHNKSASTLVGVLFLFSDLTVLLGSFSLASQIRLVLIPYLGGVVSWPVYRPMVFLGMVYVVILFYFNNLYPGYGKTAVKEIEKTSTLLTMVFLFLGGTTYLLSISEIFSRLIFILAWIFSIILVPVFRIFIRNRILKYQWYGIPVLFVTDGTAVDSILTALNNCRRMGWNPVAVFSLNINNEDLENISIPVIQSWDKFLNLKKKQQVKTALFSAIHSQENSRWLRRITEEFRTVTLIIPYYNLGSLWVKPRDLEGHLGLEITYHLLGSVSKNIKRLIDIIGSIVLLILLSPLFFVLSIIIQIQSSHPIFYSQKRLGKDKQEYDALKFRSMVNSADDILKDYLEEDPKAMAEYREFHKLSKDPRITRVGGFLRKYSLDELPQLWNVLRGDMSLIGPRAYLPSEMDDIGGFTEIIHRVRPGMTGWWQVMGRHTTTFQYRLRLDEYYISNWSLWMDLYIIYKTFWVVIQGTGT
ncbi:MAG: undecaprenyl-phosphate galactose phosphotransferase WbaP [Anaerolineaceae bacterium]|nr:undecaprenyl-phosphate galactose phosphotransferase WbaP [Anaerolineaceae bacterium]